MARATTSLDSVPSDAREFISYCEAPSNVGRCFRHILIYNFANQLGRTFDQTRNCTIPLSVSDRFGQNKGEEASVLQAIVSWYCEHPETRVVDEETLNRAVGAIWKNCN